MAKKPKAAKADPETFPDSHKTGEHKGAREIVWLPVAKLKAYDKNPRKISDQAIAKVADSIKNFGFNSPILISSDGEIAAGHTRLGAAMRLGMSTVPTITLDLTAAQIRAFRIADNKTAEFSGWDYDLLREEILALGDLDSFDALTTGFDQDEIDKLLNIGDVPSLDELESEYGEHDPVDGWPIVKLKLAPDVKEMWDSVMASAGGKDEPDSTKVERILQCIDRGALRDAAGG